MSLQVDTLPHPKGRVDLATVLSLNVTHRRESPNKVIELDTPRRRWKIAPEENNMFADLLTRLSGVVKRYNNALHVLTGDGELAKDVGMIEPALLESNASELIHNLETEFYDPEQLSQIERRRIRKLRGSIDLEVHGRISVLAEQAIRALIPVPHPTHLQGRLGMHGWIRVGEIEAGETDTEATMSEVYAAIWNDCALYTFRGTEDFETFFSPSEPKADGISNRHEHVSAFYDLDHIAQVTAGATFGTIEVVTLDHDLHLQSVDPLDMDDWEDALSECILRRKANDSKLADHLSYPESQRNDALAQLLEIASRAK